MTQSRAQEDDGLSVPLSDRNDLSHQDWLEMWQQDRTPWDLGGAHAGVYKLWDEFKDITQVPVAARRVLIPGAGRAHEAVVFLEDGCHVLACDLSEVACTAAKSMLGKFADFEYRVGDLFELESQTDIIFDRAVMCAFPTTLRQRYVQFCAHTLLSGGCLLSIPFVRLPEVSTTPYGASNRPPFFLSAAEIFELLSVYFDLVFMEPWPRVLSASDPYGDYLMIWRRR